MLSHRPDPADKHQRSSDGDGSPPFPAPAAVPYWRGCGIEGKLIRRIGIVRHGASRLLLGTDALRRASDDCDLVSRLAHVGFPHVTGVRPAPGVMAPRS